MRGRVEQPGTLKTRTQKVLAATNSYRELYKKIYTQSHYCMLIKTPSVSPSRGKSLTGKTSNRSNLNQNFTRLQVQNINLFGLLIIVTGCVKYKIYWQPLL